MAVLGIEENVGAATTYLNSATVFKAFGNPEQALPLYEKAKTIYERDLEPNDERLGGLYNNMGLALVDLKRFKEAEELCKETNELLKNEISTMLIENNILEILVWAFRLSGMEEKKNTQKQEENVFISLAKRYIDDNIEMAPSVEEVSEYCYLSTKQLTRIFQRYEDISPGEYIKNRRISKIEKLLADDLISLKQISERMNFNNEYYLNAFFKKHSGMPPGEYRKMLGQ